jgi:hypothetical protein
MIMVLMPMTLRLEASNGSGVEEYRIYEDAVEVRKLRSGEEKDDLELAGEQVSNEWQRLLPRDLSAHVRNNTVVAQWLKHRLGWRRLLRACTDPETLQEFGIPANTLDRYAA